MEQKQGLTIDMIILKFLPILGAILFITGFGYLIYTSVWEKLEEVVRLGIGFFASVLIIGTAFSFSDKLKYFADVVMGGGILLLYGTLIYGSYTTDSSAVLIPEVATIITAFIFTLFVAYFASLRKSKVILALGILGAYLTPFVIGQNDVWASNISYNSYLIYFAAVNVVIFLLGREFAIHDLTPLNLIGLFFGTYTLHRLVYSDHIAHISSNFFQSAEFTLILLSLLVLMSIFAIALSGKYFVSQEEGWISVGYLIPLVWFIFHVEILGEVTKNIESLGYAIIAVEYFLAWSYLRPLELSRYQHIASYAGGLISLVFVLITYFPEFGIYARLLIAYIGLFFALLFTFQGNKGERLLAAFLLTCVGGILSLFEIYDTKNHVPYPTLLAIISLLPGIVLYPLAKFQGKSSPALLQYIQTYSMISGIIAAFIFTIQFLMDLDFAFAFFILPGFLIVLRSFTQNHAHQNRATLMRVGVIWTSLGFFSSFIYLISNFIPHVADDEHFWINGGIFTNWYLIKSFFALITYFLALHVSRAVQKETNEDRPSFLLVIIGYTTLLLIINFAIITFCNDIGVPFTTGGIRAIATTIWWILLAVAMLMIGIYYGHGYRSEKLLGLLLLLLTIGKIAIYDLAAMSMDKKVIVLMTVGGIILLFSYFLQVKGLLKDSTKK